MKIQITVGRCIKKVASFGTTFIHCDDIPGSSDALVVSFTLFIPPVLALELSNATVALVPAVNPLPVSKF